MEFANGDIHIYIEIQKGMAGVVTVIEYFNMKNVTYA
jgi:hypothetical protein